jgi:hypothetical protein
VACLTASNGGSATRSAHLPHIDLQRLQGCLISNDPGPDIENSSSSSWSEFDGSCIAQAGGAGGTGHVAAIGTTTARDAQPASRVVSSTPQPFIFSEIIRFLLGCFGIEVGKGLLGGLLLFQGLKGLGVCRIADGGQIGLVGQGLVTQLLSVAPGIHFPCGKQAMTIASSTTANFCATVITAHP